MARSRFDTTRRLVYVRAGLTGPLGRADLLLAIDTGSALTLIRTDRLRAAGYDPAAAVERRKVRSATGEQHVPVLTVGLDCLGHSRTLLAGANEFSERFRGDGVLGLDFFAAGRLTIDTAAGWIAFRPRSARRWWRPWG